MPRRLDFVRFRLVDDELEVAFLVALELARRRSQPTKQHEPPRRRL